MTKAIPGRARNSGLGIWRFGAKSSIKYNQIYQSPYHIRCLTKACEEWIFRNEFIPGKSVDINLMTNLKYFLWNDIFFHDIFWSEMWFVLKSWQSRSLTHDIYMAGLCERKNTKNDQLIQSKKCAEGQDWETDILFLVYTKIYFIWWNILLTDNILYLIWDIIRFYTFLPTLKKIDELDPYDMCILIIILHF